MAVSEYARQEIRTFSPELAGELVGWAHAGELGNPDFRMVTAAIARVGEQGAKFAVWADPTGKTATSHDSIVGFENAYQVELSVNVSDGPRPAVVEAYGYRHDDRVLYGRGRDFLPNMYDQSWHMMLGGDDYGMANWLGGAPIAHQLKATLAAEQLDGAYAPLYYRLAVTADPETLVVDTGMAPETSRQLKTAKGITELLRTAYFEDAKMLELITEAQVGALADLADGPFTASRRQAHELEKQVFAKVGAGAFTGMRLYAPTGQGRGGREWPFMDAGTADEDKGFGPEKNGLRNGDARRAIVELGRELKELQSRIDFAETIVTRLDLLQQHETTSE